MTTTRAINMQRRRERILAEARAIISKDGFEALSTRALADAAGVTPPTLYNLIGNKQAILYALHLDTVSAIEARLAVMDGAPAVEQITAIVDQSVELFASDESYYRAGLLSARELGDALPPADIDARAVQIAIHACEQAQARGLLRGELSVEFIAGQMYRGWRVPFDDWAHGLIDLPTCRRQALQGLYSSVITDAVAPFASEILRQLKRIERESDPSTELPQTSAELSHTRAEGARR